MIGAGKGRQKRGETVPECLQVPLSVSQLTSEQFGAAAPEFISGTTKQGRQCPAQGGITAEPELLM